MPPRVNPQLSLAAVRCLKRVSEAAHGAVSAAAVSELSTAASNLLEYTAKTCTVGRANHTVMIPAGLVPAFVTAADKLNTHLKQQQQQSQPEQQQQLMMASLASALLHLWVCIGNPYTVAWVMAILPTSGPAAELALAVLTGPEGGLAPNTTHPVYKLARKQATMTVALMACCVSVWDKMIKTEAIRKAGRGSTKRGATREEAVMVSDIVQRAVILHCAVFVYQCRQQLKQQGAGSPSRTNAGSSTAAAAGSSAWAPKEAKNLLQQLGFPLDTVQQYTALLCKAMPVKDPLRTPMSDALVNLTQTINVRMNSLREAGGSWATRYAGHIAAAATAAAPANQLDRTHPDIILLQHITCPGIHPAQLVYLALEYVCVLGLGRTG